MKTEAGNNKKRKRIIRFTMVILIMFTGLLVFPDYVKPLFFVLIPFFPIFFVVALAFTAARLVNRFDQPNKDHFF